AKRSNLSEIEVARAATDLAATASSNGDVATVRRRHVGYYLVDRGRAELEQRAAFRGTVGDTVSRWVLRHPHVIFVGGVVTTTLAFLAILVWSFLSEARGSWW